MNKVLLSLSDYQIVNPVNAEIIGCQKKVLSSHYLTFLSIVKQQCTWLAVNSFLLDLFFSHLKVYVTAIYFFFLCLSLRANQSYKGQFGSVR